MIRYLDVCSGYSAFTLGAEGLGFQCVGYSEIEAFPRAVLEQRHGAVPVDWDHRFTPGSNITPMFGDFTKIEAHHVGPVQLLTGGTPCQAFSVAGKRLGLDDPRGNLTVEFLRLAQRVRADWLVWENVPGILSHDAGRTMGTFLRLLGELGYGWAYRVLDAQYIRVDGLARAVPQRRRRVFVVAHLGDAAGPAAVLFERESLRGDPAPRREAGQKLAGTLTGSFGRRCGQPNDDNPDDYLIAHPIAASLTRGAESAGKGGYAGRRQEDDVNLVAHSLRAEGFDASEDGTGRGTAIVPVAYAPEVVATLAARPSRGAGQTNSPGHNADQQLVHDGWAVRRLTPTECERLMGCTDGFTAITYRGKPAADGPRYKALGNSQARNCMRWLAKGVADVIAAQASAAAVRSAA